MTTIDTTTFTAATAFSNQRKTDRCQNGVRWAVFAPDAVRFEFWYSTDDGATWTDSTDNVSATGSSHAISGSLFIDLDDYAHFVYEDGGDGTIYYRRGTPDAACTSWTWSNATQIDSGTSLTHPDVVAHREGTGWVAHIVMGFTGVTAPKAYYSRVTIAANGTPTVGTLFELGRSSSNVNMSGFPSVDFHHTGDAKTVQGSTPHVYATWQVGQTGAMDGVQFRKATYSGGSWTWGSMRVLDSSAYAASGRISSAFDGTRVIVAYADSASTSSIKVRERDAADTTTTTRTPTALSDGVVTGLSLSYDDEGDIHLWAVGTTSDDVSRIEYDRSAGSWDGSWTVVTAADALADTLSLKRGYSDTYIDGVVTSGTGSPYDVVSLEYFLNQPPTAATWDLTDNQAHDVAETLTLDWTFNDPYPGDTQGKYALRRQIGAGSYEYWNAGTTSWGASEVENTSSTTQVALASSWGSDGDANHKYAVKTWDAAGLEGSYSSELTVIPSAQDNPTISSPADAGTVTAPSVTVTWSASTQTAYKARLLSSASAELESTGWVTSTDTSHTFAYTLANSTDYKVEVTTKNDEGLASDADTNSFSVSFTPPSTPTLTATASDANGYITVAITNPGAGATESYNDVFVRVASGGRADIDRPVGGDGIRIASGVAVDGSFIDRAVASGTDYEYLVRAVADTGATADSAWT